MPGVKKVIRAEGVEVHADVIRMRPLNMETGNHEGQNRKAEKNVVIEVKAASNKKGPGFEEYPSKGRTYKTNKAEINAKRIFGPWPSRRHGRSQKRIMAEQDVTVRFVDDWNGGVNRCSAPRILYSGSCPAPVFTMGGSP